MSTRSVSDPTVFNMIDAAVLLAAAASVRNEQITTHTLALDRPKTAAEAYVAAILMIPEVREQLTNSQFLGLARDTQVLLIKNSIRRLVRKKKLVGYVINVPTMLISSNIQQLKSGRHVMRKTRRYRPINALEALARV